MPELGPGPRVFAWVFACLCGACSSDSRAPMVAEAGPPGHDGGRAKPEGGVDAPPVTDSGTVPPAKDSGIDGADAPIPDALVNGSFDTAKVLTVGGPAMLQDVVKAYQESYFAFEGRAGAFYALTTDLGPFMPDNVLSLYGPDRELLAENDNGPRWPGDHIDARLVVRLPSDGTHYVKVVDPFLPPEAFQNSGFPLVFYHLSVVELLDGAPGVGVQGGEVRFAKEPSTGFWYTTVVGEFGASSDGGAGSDGGASQAFHFAGLAGQALIGSVLASGVHGNGSTAHFGRARVQAKDGSVLAGIDRAAGQSALHPPLAGGEYTLEMIPGGELGANAFYAVDLVMLPDNPAELQSATNGALTSAEAITMKGTRLRRGLILATVDTTDVDYFSFDVAAGESGAVVCEGESAGSGIHALHAEVRSGADAVVASADETSTENLYIEPFVFAASGTHYLRLSSTATDSPAVVPWARCAVDVSP